MRTRRQALGQHFLKDQSVIRRILELVQKDIAELKPEAVLEVGPGKWAITNGLADLCTEAKIPLILVERDQRLRPEIEERLEDRAPSLRGELHMMDAASEGLPQLAEKLAASGIQRILFVSNLPYSASSQILANLCIMAPCLTSAIVMTQKELAERIDAEPGTKDRGSFSILMQSYFKTKWSFDVPPGAFAPPPKVMSTVFRLEPLQESLVSHLRNPNGFQNFCKQLFSQRRKMIRKLVPERAVAHFAKLGISGIERPETLSLETLIELYRVAHEE